MKAYGLYFVLLGIFGMITAFARARSEREVYLILATIPTAFLTLRVVEFLRNRKQK